VNRIDARTSEIALQYAAPRTLHNLEGNIIWKLEQGYGFIEAEPQKKKQMPGAAWLRVAPTAIVERARDRPALHGDRLGVF